MRPSIPLYHIQPRPNVYKLPPVEPWELLQREDEADVQRTEMLLVALCAFGVFVGLAVLIWVVL